MRAFIVGEDEDKDEVDNRGDTITVITNAPLLSYMEKLWLWDSSGFSRRNSVEKVELENTKPKVFKVGGA